MTQLKRIRVPTDDEVQFFNMPKSGAVFFANYRMTLFSRQSKLLILIEKTPSSFSNSS